MSIFALKTCLKVTALLALLLYSDTSSAQLRVNYVSSTSNTGGGVLNMDYNNEYTQIAFVRSNNGPVTISKYLWDSSFTQYTSTPLSINYSGVPLRMLDFRNQDSLVTLFFASQDSTDVLSQNGFTYDRLMAANFYEGPQNSLIKQADLDLDSLYIHQLSAEIRVQGNLLGDDIMTLVSGATPSAIASFPKSFLIKHNLSSESTTVLNVDEVPGYQEQFSYSGTGQLNRHIVESPVPGYYLADLDFYNNDRTMSTANIGLFDANFDTILKMWPRNNGAGFFSRIMVRDSTVLVYSSGGRLQNNIIYEDFCVSTFNFFEDSLVTSYLIELIDSNSRHWDIAYPGCVWLDNGYMVFTGISDSNDVVQGQKNKLSIFSMNPNFQVVKAAFVDNIPSGPPLPVIWPTSVISYPKSSDTVIFAGSAINPDQNRVNLFWGKFGYKDNSIGIEDPIFKVNPQYLQVFPNPAPNGNVTIFNQDPQERPFTIKVFNINGEAVKYFENLNGQKNYIKLGLAAGVYQLQFRQGTHQEQHRLVVQ